MTSNAHIQNNEEFVLKCGSLSHNGKMLSLDVDSLFTKVLVNETIDFLKRNLPEWDVNLPINYMIYT